MGDVLIDGKRFHDEEDSFGFRRRRVLPKHGLVADMQTPVVCTHCGQVYDAGRVTVTQRYADCSVWQSPCCNRQVDDRTWKSLPDIRKIERR